MSETILVIDDQADIRALLSMALAIWLFGFCRSWRMLPAASGMPPGISAKPSISTSAAWNLARFQPRATTRAVGFWAPADFTVSRARSTCSAGSGDVPGSNTSS